MRRKSLKRPLLIACFFVCLLLLPSLFVQKLRGRLFSIFSPICRSVVVQTEDEIHQRLEAENHLLRLELMRLHEASEELKLYEDNVEVVPAHVIYRDPGQWMTTCWIDVGERTNQALGKPIIQHNAPVLVGKALVGVVDKVYEKQSSIRLITDPSVKPSVRVVRGYLHNVIFSEQLKAVVARLESKAPPTVIEYLTTVQQTLEGPATDWLLAKGVIQGSGVPMWRGRSRLLRGIGFNCDFPDGGGQIRELRSGKPLDKTCQEAMPIIQEKDMLFTTGLDGVFPMGLPVAEVTKVFPLREGAYAYEIEATPIVKNLEALQTVCVIPKVEFTLP